MFPHGNPTMVVKVGDVKPTTLYLGRDWPEVFAVDESASARPTPSEISWL